MTNINESLEIAAKLMISLHSGQTDKSGEPYFLHPMRVASALYPNKKAMIVGLLHDVIEDCDISLERLKLLDFDQEIIDAIDSVSIRKDENYAEFIYRACQNKIGILVKYLDILDNSRTERLAKLDLATQQRLCAKYGTGLRIIREFQQNSKHFAHSLHC